MDTGILDRVISVGSELRRYAVIVPIDYDGSRPLPAILHLHGMGECGVDGMYQLWHGAPRAVLKDRPKWPFIIICPQKADVDAEWFNERPLLNSILGSVEREFKIDPHKRYLTGLSQGGRGTMRLAKHLKWQFAALAPVCGWVDDPVAIAKELRGTPIWFFHGEDDTAVPPSGSKDMVSELQKLGEKPKLTLYPGVGHGCWPKAYEEEDLGAWFLSYSLD